MKTDKLKESENHQAAQCDIDNVVGCSFDEDEWCNKCGSSTYWEPCHKCGGEGGKDGDELMMEDPLWYNPDDFETCDECNGKGSFKFCLNEKCEGE